MKKIFLFALAVTLLTTSCNRNNNNDFNLDLPESYHFATVMEVEPDTATQDEDSTSNPNIANIYFELDSQEKFIVTENISKTDLDDLQIGQRVITGVTLTEISDSIYNYTAKLYEVVDVRIGENVTVETEQQNDSIANHPFAYIAKDITLTQGYLNLLTCVVTEDNDNVKFYLVDNQFDESKEEEEGYLYLELRHDSANEDDKGREVENYVSFDMEQYREELADLKGILLCINTEKSGSFTVKVNSKDLY